MENCSTIKIKASNFVMQHVGKLKNFYKIGRKLGEGAFGEVRICKLIEGE